MQRNETLTTTTGTMTDAHNLDVLVHRALATDDRLQLADWLASNGAAHLSQIERIELAERLITRRRFLIGAGALGLGVITGCGAEEQAATPTATTEATRTVEHALGTTEVPVEPQRVVTLGIQVTEVALALGIQPIATTNQNFTYPHLDLGSAENVGEIGAVNLEAIATTNPDLILAFASPLEEIYEEISQIAPTVGVRWPGSSANWKEFGRSFAAVLRGDSGEQRYNELVSAYEQRAEEVGQQIRQARGEEFTVAVMRARSNEQRFELPNMFSGSVVYRDVGLPVPQGLRELAEADEFNLPVSLEELSRGDAEVIFVYAGVGADADEQAAQQIEALVDEPVFQNLRAAQSGNVYPGGAHWFSGAIIAAPLILDDLEQTLLG